MDAFIIFNHSNNEKVDAEWFGEYFGFEKRMLLIPENVH